MDKFSLDDKFSRIADHWRPRIAAEANGQELKLIKVQGIFPWHVHEKEDELFLVWRGTFRVEFREYVVVLEAGEGLVVPRGVEHRTASDAEAQVLCFEPAATRNTGNTVNEFTAANGVSI